MPRSTDVRATIAQLYFLPIQTRMPLKFGPEVTTEVTCARVRLTVTDSQKHSAEGWGETPLSVQWVWPSGLSYEARNETLKDFCRRLTEVWTSAENVSGHPIEVGHFLLDRRLPKILRDYNETVRRGQEPMPWLAALVCASAFDLALHDAYGKLHGVPTYRTYNDSYMNADLSRYLEPAEGADVSFHGLYPESFLVPTRPDEIPAWHLIGGKDPIDPSELTGNEPDDGEPVLLRDWIRRDGLNCLKIKLRGNDPEWDWERLVRVGAIAQDEGVDWLTTDFNCTVQEPTYVNTILDRLLVEHPRIYGMILYVEQPFPYDLEDHRIDVHSVSAQAFIHG